MCVHKKIVNKDEVNWNTVCGAMQDQPRSNILSGDNQLEVLNDHLLLLVGCCPRAITGPSSVDP